MLQNLYNDRSTLTTVNIGGDTENPTVSLNATQGVMLDNFGGYRYYGASPNNYVSFNGELWRIISTSDVRANSDAAAEMRVKLIKDDHIGQYSFDSSDASINDGYGINDWSKADLNTLLNDLYYNGKSGSCYYGRYNETTSCNFTSNSLGDGAKRMIDNALWFLGGAEPDHAEYVDDYYYWERNTVVYDCEEVNDGACPRATSWTGKVGLMYPSDYMYAADLSLCKETEYDYDNSNCSGNNWLYKGSSYQWLLNPHAGWYYNNFVVDSVGKVSIYVASQARWVYPVVYLKSDVIIYGGTGTSRNPYILG